MWSWFIVFLLLVIALFYFSNIIIKLIKTELENHNYAIQTLVLFNFIHQFFKIAIKSEISL